MSKEIVKIIPNCIDNIGKYNRKLGRYINYRGIRELIFESSNILIIGHKNPDMDSFGASVGLWSAIRQLGKSCNVIIDNDINAIDYYIRYTYTCS